MKIPSFASEEEEARWWFEHRDEAGEALVTASRNGLRGVGSRGRLEQKLNALSHKSPSRTDRETFRELAQARASMTLLHHVSNDEKPFAITVKLTIFQSDPIGERALQKLTRLLVRESLSA